jgi:diguanylate cyclase (GGDEF)-like protein
MTTQRIPDGEPPMSLSNLFDIYGLMVTPYMFATEKLTLSILDKLRTEIFRLDHLSFDVQQNIVLFLGMAYEDQQKLKKLSWKLRETEVGYTELELENKKLEKIAYTDVLTGIFNRAGFLRELKTELATFNDIDNESRCEIDGAAVVFIDLRKFKPINDTYGHAAGDKALQRVSEILQEETREEDVVGRWGGDEFVVMIKSINSPDSEAVLERLNKKLDHIPLDIEGQTIYFSARTGKIHIKLGQKADQIMHEADMDMINSKDPRDRESTVQLIDNSMRGPR